MLSIYYPFKPFNVTQNWGNPNPEYATHFNDPSFKLHNGIDAKPDWNLKTYPVYCPVEGFYVENVQFVPEGGGNEIWLRSKGTYTMFEQECYARIIMCHHDKILVKAGYEPALGELLSIGDNTGFSTGPHTHIGLYRIDRFGNKLDTNEATGSFNPALFFNNQFAVDKATTSTLIKSGLRYYAYILGLK